MSTALDYARYIVSKCNDDNKPVSNLQLQKILYYIQKFFLKQGEPAFNDDIEAWQFGPVVPDVYYYYCGYGAMPITFQTEEAALDENIKKFVNPIIEEKRDLPPWTMVADTHRNNGAWAKVYMDGSGIRQTIPKELIADAG